MRIFILANGDAIIKELAKRELEENNSIKKQLDIANKKLDEIEEYITSYESISTIQGLENIKMNKYLDDKTMVEMTNRYFKVHDKILSIIGSNDEKC